MPLCECCSFAAYQLLHANCAVAIVPPAALLPK